MVSTSGSQLLPLKAIRELRELLLPLTTILTPNVPEAKLLLSNAGIPVSDPHSLEDLIDIARKVYALGPKWVLVKGGHLPFQKDGKTVARKDEDREKVVDVLVGQEGAAVRIESAYQNSRNTHGTGCSLACKVSFALFLVLIREKRLIKRSGYYFESREWIGCGASC